MSRKYTYSLNNKLSNYTIYCDGVELDGGEVVKMLELADIGIGANVQPSYYDANGVSPLDCFRDGLISREELVGFCKGNIVKYVVRAGLKDGESAVKDFSKARVYLDVLLDLSKNTF